MKQLLLALTFFSFNALYSSPLTDSLPTAGLLEGTHAVSTSLAYDRFSDARNEATKLLPIIQDWLDQATESHTGFASIKKLQTGMNQLSNTSEEAALRVAFSVASEGMVEFVRADLELRKSWQLHFCPHVEGHYAYWIQPLTEKRMNPYFGQAMFGCGVKKPW